MCALSAANSRDDYRRTVWREPADQSERDLAGRTDGRCATRCRSSTGGPSLGQACPPTVVLSGRVADSRRRPRAQAGAWRARRPGPCFVFGAVEPIEELFWPVDIHNASMAGTPLWCQRHSYQVAPSADPPAGFLALPHSIRRRRRGPCPRCDLAKCADDSKGELTRPGEGFGCREGPTRRRGEFRGDCERGGFPRGVPPEYFRRSGLFERGRPSPPPPRCLALVSRSPGHGRRDADGCAGRGPAGSQYVES